MPPARQLANSKSPGTPDGMGPPDLLLGMWTRDDEKILGQVLTTIQGLAISRSRFSEQQIASMLLKN